MPFLDQVTQLMTAAGKPGGTTRKTTTKAAVRKAAIKKKSMARKKAARTV